MPLCGSRHRRHPALQRPHRLRAGPAPLQGTQHRVPLRHHHDDAAAPSPRHPDVLDVGPAPSHRHHLAVGPPSLFGDAFSVFLLRQFLLTVPEDYLNAARVDGCGRTARAHPGGAADDAPRARRGRPVLLLQRLERLLRAPDLHRRDARPLTLALGLATFKTSHAVQWNLTMAATLIAMAPVIIVFFFAQKAFIEGVTLTGVKG
ncbi:hypothetical protein ACRAWF_26080 [Streptomyces sp. L7]